MSGWYVIASKQKGDLVHFRIVAGPLHREAAAHEAHLRVGKAPKGFALAIAEFDPLFGLTET
jgi:hypothetical protein